MYDTKCIFSAHIMCMVHTPFKEQLQGYFNNNRNDYFKDNFKENIKDNFKEILKEI